MAPNPNRKSDTRLAAAVIIGAMILWMGGSFLGGTLGISPQYAFLIDLIALAAFAFAIIVLIRVWREGPTDKG